jgi:hypothetical protein
MQSLLPFVPVNLLPIVNGTLANKPHWVYILAIELPHTTLYKVGMSNDVAKRVKSLASLEKPSSKVRGKGIIIHNIQILATAIFANFSQAIVYEKYLLDNYCHHKYNGEPVLSQGNTELFTHNILALVQAEHGQQCS